MENELYSSFEESSRRRCRKLRASTPIDTGAIHTNPHATSEISHMFIVIWVLGWVNDISHKPTRTYGALARKRWGQSYPTAVEPNITALRLTSSQGWAELII